MTAAQAREVRDALLDHGVALVLCNGPLGAWDQVGDDWQEGRPTGVIEHNTSTMSATGPTGRPSLEWLLAPGYSKPAANLLTARGTPAMEGVQALGGSSTCALTFAAGLRSVLHCGKGGPWQHVQAAQDIGHRTLLGVEHDARQVYPGSEGALTEPQVEAGARIAAAIADMWGGDLTRIGTHTCWTDGCHTGDDGGPDPSGPFATVGRKDDTVGCGWSKRLDPAQPYNALFWRDKARAYLRKPGPTPTTGDLDMILINLPRSKWRLLSGNTLLDPGADGAAILQSAGVPVKVVTQAEWDTFNAKFPFVAK